MSTYEYEPTDDEIQFATFHNLPWDFNARSEPRFHDWQVRFRGGGQVIIAHKPIPLEEAVTKLAAAAGMTMAKIQSKKRGRVALIRGLIVYIIREGMAPLAMIPSYPELGRCMRPHNRSEAHSTMHGGCRRVSKCQY